MTGQGSVFFRCCCVVCLLCAASCRKAVPTIAFIPRTSGTSLWEPAHGGAELASRSIGTTIYWNAPTREDDVQAQIALLERVIDRGYEGIVLAPDQSLALISPVRRALSEGTPVVIIGSPLPIPPGQKLSYIINDEEQAARMAVDRIAHLLRGKGTVALLGVDPDIAGIMTRTRNLEIALAQGYPLIKIIEKRLGSFNVQHDQQVAEETLRANPHLDAIVTLTSAATRGTFAALGRGTSKRTAKVVAFDDPDVFLLPWQENLDSVIVQNSREMGFAAVNTIAAQLRGDPVPAQVKLKPILVTRENADSSDVRRMFSMIWRLQQ